MLVVSRPSVRTTSMSPRASVIRAETSDVLRSLMERARRAEGHCRWLRGQDLNLRPSGYEPDELPGCSTPRQGSTPNKAAEATKKRMGWKTWRRPTLPRLRTQYHGRWGFSRPSSGWDRVQAPRQSHQVIQPIRIGLNRGSGAVRCYVLSDLRMISMHGVDLELYRAIRTSQLRALPPLHTWPIDVMVYHGPQGDLVSRWVSRLDAFSGYPVHT